MLEGVNGKEDWIVEESVFVGIDVSKVTLDMLYVRAVVENLSRIKTRRSQSWSRS